MNDLHESNVVQYAKLRVATVAAVLLMPWSVFASSVPLADAPLQTIEVDSQVLPNLMIVFDDSGSMARKYMPDWADASDYRLQASVYNTLYYNPALTYSSPAFFNADGSSNTTTYPSWDGKTSATGGDAGLAFPNWNKVKSNPYTGTGTTPLSSQVRLAYVAEPGEYCKDVKLTTCQATETSVFKYPAPLRWCNSATNAKAASPADGTCQAVRKTGYTNARMPSPRTATFTVDNVSSGATVTSIKVGTKEILSTTVTSTSGSESDMAQKIVDAINACNGIATGGCGVAGFAATRSDATITITAGKGTLTTPVATKGGGTFTYSTAAFSTNVYPGNMLLRIIDPGTAAVYPYPGLYPGRTSIAKAPTRTDCTTNDVYCTGNEEMTNYANWYSYYRTRSQSLKTSMSLAFKPVDARYRIGITAQSYDGTTDSVSGGFLKIGKYEGTHKNTFLKTLFAMPAGSYTPTRSALAKVGKIYAGKKGADPVQYSCQKNYAFVATDGYWNSNEDFGAPWGFGVDVGNVDGWYCKDVLKTQCKSGSDSTYKYPLTNRPYLDTNNSSNSLADIARYYYVTDLRSKALNNCRGGVLPDGASQSSPTDDDTKGVCPNDYGIQRMSVFSLGLGVDGSLQYTTDYRSATTGDYADLVAGTNSVNWPLAAQDSPTAIDDLWHAAVNTDGIYFSAKSPTDVVKSLQDALGQIDKVIGSGAAAASSSLQPTAGDNYSYVASYASVDWIGNLEKRFINLKTGATSVSASWCIESVKADSCIAPGVLTSVTEGSSTSWVCRTTVGPDVTDVPIAITCTGTLGAMVSANGDSRTILMSSGSGLQDFTYSNVSARGLNAHFDNAWLKTKLSQNSVLSSEQLAAMNGSKLVGYLRGQYGYDMRSSNAAVDRLFRTRAATFGDIVSSQPAYVKKPTFSYTDPGYSAFKAAKASRAATVYVGANDGMLHAFNAENGAERWAFIPTPVIPELWRLADSMYSTNHHYYADGAPYIADICTANCTDSATAVWKTILVAGLNGGGRGYYALDVTNPDSPSLLWEFLPSSEPDIGFSYGNPVVTKMKDGTWVVLLTSGYNNGTGSGDYDGGTEVPNSPAGSGKGILYVLKADAGTVLRKIATSAGTPATPSGLSKIAAWADNAEKYNIATYVYGGDLLGNLWRFDINETDSAKRLMQFATLKDALGKAQPITTKPELGLVNRKRMVFVGTGKYLEASDTESASFSQQTLYGIMDADASATLTDPRSVLVKQIQTNDGINRKVTSNSIDYSTKRGWYIDFADAGERQNVDGMLVFGTLLTPTTVPTSSVCSPGGYSWLNFVDYKTGGYVAGATNSGVRYGSIIVGLGVMYLDKDGDGDREPVVTVTVADEVTPKVAPGIPFGSGGEGFTKRKMIWRELIE